MPAFADTPHHQDSRPLDAAVQDTRLGGGDAGSLPRHVAIIMDGNGRWAKQRGLPRVLGHRQGATAVRRLVEHAARRQLGVITLYSFSTENWKRSHDEVADLMGLLRHYLKNELATLTRNQIRLRVIGDRSVLASDLQALIAEAEARTAGNERLLLQLAVSYGGRQDLVQAARKLAEGVAAGRLSAEDIDEDALASALSTSGTCDPDLVIRTSGEQRLSNFLLWESAYAEFYFTPVLWPDFDASEMDRALDVYSERHRRFGGR